MKQVICIKWGTKYTAGSVNRIYQGLARFTTPPFQMYCFTDDAEGIRDEVICNPLPDLGCPPPKSSPGKWRKTALWGTELHGVTGTVLFVDLDSVISGSLDEFFTLGGEDDVYLAKNWVKPFSGLGQTSVFRYTIGRHTYLLDKFRQDPEGVSSEYVFEQHFVTKNVRGGVKFWPNRWVSHFRLHCLGAWPLRFFRMAKCPQDAKIITFPGGPLPEDAVEGRWEKDGKFQSIPDHFSSVWSRDDLSFKQKLRYSRFYLYPVTWIRDLWGKE